MSRRWGRQLEYPSRSPVRRAIAVLALSLGALVAVSRAHAQDLTPRAYVITPTGTNAVIFTDVYNDGDLNFEGAAPIEDATARINMAAIGYARSLGLFGRSANVNVVLPYGDGTFDGTVLGAPYTTYRNGFFDLPIRLSVNLAGGPAMGPAEWTEWRQTTLLGASLKVTIPIGQYDPTKLVNLGSNRWAFKPELGLSHRHGHWIVDAYGAVWLFTRNPEFFSRNQYVAGTQSQTQDPIWITEMHLSYDVRPRLWVSFDGNFWTGGTTSTNGAESPNTLQRSSRVGATASVPLNGRQSVKFGFARGAYARFGGDYDIYSAAWQYTWLSMRR